MGERETRTKRGWFRRGSSAESTAARPPAPAVDDDGDRYDDPWSADAWSEEGWDDDWNDRKRRARVRPAADPTAAAVDAWLESDHTQFEDVTADMARKWTTDVPVARGATWDADQERDAAPTASPEVDDLDEPTMFADAPPTEVPVDEVPAAEVTGDAVTADAVPAVAETPVDETVRVDDEVAARDEAAEASSVSEEHAVPEVPEVPAGSFVPQEQGNGFTWGSVGEGPASTDDEAIPTDHVELDRADLDPADLDPADLDPAALDPADLHRAEQDDADADLDDELVVGAPSFDAPSFDAPSQEHHEPLDEEALIDALLAEADAEAAREGDLPVEAAVAPVEAIAPPAEPAASEAREPEAAAPEAAERTDTDAHLDGPQGAAVDPDLDADFDIDADDLDLDADDLDHGLATDDMPGAATVDVEARLDEELDRDLDQELAVSDVAAAADTSVALDEPTEGAVDQPVDQPVDEPFDELDITDPHEFAVTEPAAAETDPVTEPEPVEPGPTEPEPTAPTAHVPAGEPADAGALPAPGATWDDDDIEEQIDHLLAASPTPVTAFEEHLDDPFTADVDRSIEADLVAEFGREEDDRPTARPISASSSPRATGTDSTGDLAAPAPTYDAAAPVTPTITTPAPLPDANDDAPARPDRPARPEPRVAAPVRPGTSRRRRPVHSAPERPTTTSRAGATGPELDDAPGPMVLPATAVQLVRLFLVSGFGLAVAAVVRLIIVAAGAARQDPGPEGYGLIRRLGDAADQLGALHGLLLIAAIVCAVLAAAVGRGRSPRDEQLAGWVCGIALAAGSAGALAAVLGVWFVIDTGESFSASAGRFGELAALGVTSVVAVWSAWRASEPRPD